MTMTTITTYQELNDFVEAFGNGHFKTLVICSRGGLGKTEETRRTLNSQQIVSIGGHVTPLKLYELLYNGCDQYVVFDEIDGLLSDTRHVGLLKQLCETQETKRIMWSSADPRAAEVDGGAGHFHTRSHVLVLCNSFLALSANVAALKTRATTVQFVPPSAEILAKIKTFATDHEIIAFLDRLHGCLPEFSLRTYGHLEELKQAGLDWEKYALQQTDVPPKVIEIADLLACYGNDIERIKHYSASRRDFYYWKPRALAYLQQRSQASEQPALKLLPTPLDETDQCRSAE